MIENGKTVKVHYTGKLENGTEFDSSLQRDPLEFTIGAGQLIRGFESGVVGMSVGEKKTLKLSPEEAYGPIHESMVLTIPKSNAPPDVQIGSQLQAEGQDGKDVVFIVRQVNEDNVVIDGNHPLAGKTLLFDIEVVDVK
jgi:peptidylprolyl isomerase